MTERLTVRGVDGIKAFCSGCSERPMIGKCDIGAECYWRQIFKRAQAYEDTTLSPEEITQMQAELQKYQQAEAEGRLVMLPCKAGDKMFSLRWSVKKEKYELHTSEIKNVRYDSYDGSVMVSDGARFCAWGESGFATPEEAETALKKQKGD